MDLADGLARRGHEVSLLAATFDSVAPGVTRVPLAFTGLTRLRRYVCFLDALTKHLAAQSYDVVHAMLPVPRCDVYHPHAGMAAEGLAAPGRGIAGFFNRLNRKRRRYAQVERRMLDGPRPPIVLCLSNYVRQSIGRYYPLDQLRIEPLFNAVDLDRFHPDGDVSAALAVRNRLGIAPGRVVGLFIAHHFARKGLREAIEALAAGPKELTLLVVGKDSPRAFARQAAQLGVADRVAFAGAAADPLDFYRAADFFVLPTYHDPCSLVVLEALAMGLPVVTTRFNGAAEVMTPGQHGFVIDRPTDIKALAAAMTALTDAAARAQTRAAALALRPQLSHAHHLDTLLGIYGRIGRG